MIPGVPSIGSVELIILVGIILVFFGAKRIPDLARSLGKGTHEFRKGLRETTEDETHEAEERKHKDEKEKPSLNGATAVVAHEEDEMPRVEAEATHTEQQKI
jgi:sec-independent protein translocase protein TatA